MVLIWGFVCSFYPTFSHSSQVAVFHGVFFNLERWKSWKRAKTPSRNVKVALLWGQSYPFRWSKLPFHLVKVGLLWGKRRSIRPPFCHLDLTEKSLLPYNQQLTKSLFLLEFETEIEVGDFYRATEHDKSQKFPCSWTFLLLCRSTPKRP